MNKYTPLVSVIVPVYNVAPYIQRALESVFAQSYPSIEVIVVDDGSTDETPHLLDTYRDRRNMIFLSQKNQGQSIARDHGVRMAKGEYVAFLDGDDAWCDTNKLLQQVDFLTAHPEYVLVGTSGEIVDDNAISIMSYHVPKDDRRIRRNMLLKNPFIISSVLVRTHLLRRYGIFTISGTIQGNEDYSVWLRLALIGKVANLPGSMVQYMTRYDNTSGRQKRLVLRDNIHIISRYRHQYPHARLAMLFSWGKYFGYRALGILIQNEAVRRIIARQLFSLYRRIRF